MVEAPASVVEMEEFPPAAPVLTPIELPLDGVVPDPPAEPEEKKEEPKAPMLDFSAPPKSPEEGDSSSSLADLFGGTEEETESSLGNILEKAPQASITEILEDLAEIKEMLRGRLDTQ